VNKAVNPANVWKRHPVIVPPLTLTPKDGNLKSIVLHQDHGQIHRPAFLTMVLR